MSRLKYLLQLRLKYLLQLRLKYLLQLKDCMIEASCWQKYWSKEIIFVECTTPQVKEVNTCSAASLVLSEQNLSAELFKKAKAKVLVQNTTKSRLFEH